MQVGNTSYVIYAHFQIAGSLLFGDQQRCLSPEGVYCKLARKSNATDQGGALIATSNSPHSLVCCRDMLSGFHATVRTCLGCRRWARVAEAMVEVVIFDRDEAGDLTALKWPGLRPSHRDGGLCGRRGCIQTAFLRDS
jgi:hypothetical protein